MQVDQNLKGAGECYFETDSPHGKVMQWEES